MANFIFNEGAALLAGAGLDWTGTAYDCALVDDSLGVPVVNTNTWSDLSGASTAVQAFSNKTITSFGAVSADPLTFASVSPTDIDGRFLGFAIKRNSDDLLIAWFDTGFTSLSPQSESVPIGNILGAAIASATYTFTLRPGINNESAWFRP
jgi:hypothetical protein